MGYILPLFYGHDFRFTRHEAEHQIIKKSTLQLFLLILCLVVIGER